MRRSSEVTLLRPSGFVCGGFATLMVSKGTLEMFRGSKISTAAACCFWAWRYFSVVKSGSFMMTQRRVSDGSSADRASATTMAPRQPGQTEKAGDKCDLLRENSSINEELK